MSARLRLLAPEVVQTSSMDCGPAALKCLLEGFGVRASYGRLRDACCTDVDGTSIDTIEDIAVRLGLDAEQVVLPVDYVLDPRADAGPALVVVRLPGGATHFVVKWRDHGGLIQVMDPAVGRRWLSTARFLESVYVHTARVPVPAWRDWASSAPALAILHARLARSGVDSRPFVDGALRDASWRGLAALDAGCRAIRTLQRAGAIGSHGDAAHVLRRLIVEPDLIDRKYWSVESAGDEELLMSGAVLVRVRGVREPAPIDQLSADLAAALAEPPNRPGLELWRLLRADGALTPAVVAAGLVPAAAGVTLEALLLRGLLDAGRELPLAGQRMAAMTALLAFVLLLVIVEARLSALVTQLGRRLDVRLRLAFLRKIPRLGDRYFRTRLTSDMAERSHVTHRIRTVPDLAARLARSAFELVFTTAAIAWVDPAAGPVAFGVAVCTVGIPLGAAPRLIERDLRLRTHTGALCRFYLDALIGLVAIRTHGGERAVRREHGRLLGEWARAGLAVQRTAVRTEALQLLLAFALIGWTMLGHVAGMADGGPILLLAYWLLSLPAIGDELALAVWHTRHIATPRSASSSR